MTLSTTSPAALILAGSACLAWGVYRAYETHGYLGRAVLATATVISPADGESNSMLVDVRDEHGRLAMRLPVRVAWWTPPWLYVRGDDVDVVYDPAGDYDLPFGDRGRIRSWAQLWAGAVFWSGIGLAFVALGVWARRTGVRVELLARVAADGRSRDG